MPEAQEASKKSDKKKSGKKSGKKPAKSLIFRIFKYGFLSLFLIIALVLAGAIGFGGWVTQSASGQAWLVKTVNKYLGPQEDNKDREGLAYKITKLEGSLPFDFQLGLEVYDSKGLFCSAPDNAFQLNWRELPATVAINGLVLKNIDLSRFPDLPPSPKPQTDEPEKPFTVADLQNYLKEAADFLDKKHWWLPDIKISGVELANVKMPPDLIEKNARIALNADLKADMIDNVSSLSLKFSGANENKKPVDLGQIKVDDLNLALNFGLTPQENALNSKTDLNVIINNPRLNIDGFPADYLGEKLALTLDLAANAVTDQNPSVKIALAGPDIRANHISLSNKINWDSGLAWPDGGIDGPFTLILTAGILPEDAEDAPDKNAPLNILAAPVRLNFNAQGNLPKISLKLALDGNKLVYDKYIIENVDLKLASGELDLPLSEKALAALTKENRLRLDFSALIEKEKIELGTELFAQALEITNSGESEKIWRLGLRKLNLEALGANLKGGLAALINPAETELSRKILLDGDLALKLRQWDAVDKFLPDQKINGDLQANINLVSGAENTPLNPMTSAPDFNSVAQLAKADILAKNFHWQPKEGQGAYLGFLQVASEVKDPLADLEFTARVKGEKIRYDKFDLNLGLETEGKPQGPVKADLTTTGNVVSKLSAEWQPGLATLKALNIKMNSAALMGRKGAEMGVALANSAQVSYGDAGLGVKNLDIKILPSGRITANGSLTREKMDMAITLADLKFKPWQAVIPQIPGGEANISARITGEPNKPGGSFRIQLKEIAVPGNTIPPVSLNLDGVIRNAGAGSMLAAKLDIDPKTVKLLGGSLSQINAQIPLTFAENGVPNVNMDGPLSARVVWDGALGPIWNLVPLADQRVNGRINVNIDAGGTLKRPRIRGGVKIDKARYENILYGVLLTDINARVDLSQKETGSQTAPAGIPGSMNLALSLSDGHGGTLKVTGTGALNGDDLKIAANMDRLKPLRRRDIHVELSGDATVTGSAAAPNIKGKITVNRGEVLLDNLSIAGGSVTTLDITQPVKKGQKEKEVAQEKPAQAKGAGSLDVRIVMLPRFTVEGRGLGSIWEANLLVRGTPEDPKITGSINCVSGNFDFLGKIFALSKGQVTFAGGSLSNPMLDIDLTNETPDLTAHILIRGPVNKMRLILTSDPSLPRDDILSRVLFGKSVNDLSRLEALQLAGAVAQLAGFGGGGGILNFTKKALGLDVLRVGTSSSDAAGDGDDDAGGTTIEAGKYLNDYTYMGVQQGLTPDSTAFIIQLELTPRTSLEVRTENNNTWGGLNWKYNY